MNLKYALGALFSIPLAPLLYVQGKQIRARVPELPEANGVTGSSSTKNGTPLHMITIGESTIAGVGVATHQEGFTGTLAEELSNHINTTISWKVYAKSGFTAKDVLEEIIPTITDSTIDLIVIGLGGNDAFTLNRPKNWNLNIKGIIQQLKNKYPNSPIVFLNMPPIKVFPAFTKPIKFVIGNLVELLGNELDQTIQEFENVFYYANTITIQDWRTRLNLTEKVDDFFSDGVHPSKLAYQVWAKDLAHFLIETPAVRVQLIE